MSEVFKAVNLPNMPNPVIVGAGVSGISSSGSTLGVYGQSVSQSGVWGTSKTGDGVDGSSDSGVGVKGTSNSQSGVVGTSTSGDGVWAQGGSNGVYGKTSNDSASGVYGVNFGKGPGVSGASQYGPSVVGVGYNGNLAGQFQGKLDVTDLLTAAALTASGVVTAGSMTTKGDITAGSFTTSGDVTAFDVKLTGGDIAEEFGTAVGAEPGTVMVIGEGGSLTQSSLGYDRMVAGVISGAGDLKPGVVLDRRPGETGRSPLAMVGKVYCKVDATYGPIAIGDLLTTSPTPGHAMKAADQSRAFGCVIGKALRRLESGSGLIPILVALQ